MKTLNQNELESVSGGINPLLLPAIIIAIPVPLPAKSDAPAQGDGGGE